MTDIAHPSAPRGAATAPAALRAEVRALALLAWPIVLTQLGQIAILTTDVLIVARLGEQDLAAVTLGVNVFFALFVVGMGILMATAALAAQAHGARRPRMVRRVIREGLWLTIFMAVPAMAALLFTEEILLAAGQEPALAAGAAEYNRALLWAMPSALGFMVLRNFVSAIDRPRPALWVMLGAIPVNAALVWLLVFGGLGIPALGLTGAGIASSIVNGLMFLVLLAICLRQRPFRRYAILGRFWRQDWAIMRQVLVVGAPIAGTLLLEVGAFISATMMVGWLGGTALAAHQIALQVASITFMVPFGLAQAATVRVGNAVGRRDPEGAVRAGWVALGVGFAFMATMAILIGTSREDLVRLYMDEGVPGGATVVPLAATLLLVAAFFQVADGAQAIAAGALRGMNDTAVPAIFAATGYWGLGLTTGYVAGFVFGLGAIGIWIGLAAGLLVVAVMLVSRFRYRARRPDAWIDPIAPARPHL